MKLKVTKSELNEAIQNAAKAISNKSAIPILQGIKIESDERGMILTASDSEISIQSYISIEKEDQQIIYLEQAGSVVLPAKFFSEMIRKLPSNQIEIEVNHQFQTTIRSGKIELQLSGLDPEEYPLLPQVNGSNIIEITSETLKTMIRQTVYAVSTNESTPILTGVLWNAAEGRLKLSACDRHRLANSETTISNDEVNFGNIVISGRTLNELLKIISDHNELVTIIFSENQVMFKTASVTLYTQVLVGTYPDTSKLIPQTFSTELVVETKKLSESIDRAYLLSREEKTNIVRLVMKDHSEIEISSYSNEIGKITELIETKEISGELLKISFNSKYMLDALKVLDCEHIHIGFTGAMHPIIIKPLESNHTLQLVLPYRTTN